MPFLYETGDKLYSQETYAISVIGMEPGKNISSLAETLGVTKGTISPLVSKLAKRGFVRKYKGGDNNKEVLLDLTMTGKLIFHEHEMKSLQYYSELFEPFEQENSEYLGFLLKFLDEAERLQEKHRQELLDQLS